MSDLIDRGLAWLKGKREHSMARSGVSYVRGETVLSLDPGPTIGRSRFDQVGPSGTVEVETRDYLVSAALLQEAGLFPPQRGDVLRDELGPEGATQEYKVLPADGVPAWSWSDPFHRVVRVHTKYVGEAD